MYRLNNTTQRNFLSGDAAEEAARAKEFALARLRDAFADLDFEPVTHTYTIAGRKVPSVSSLVAHFDPFDATECAKRVSKNNRHELFGKSIEDILAIWEIKGKEAASAGTVVHEFGEACFLCKENNARDIEDGLRSRLSSDGTLEAASPKEESLARWWDSLDLSRYVLIAKETRIYNPELYYAGTFDVLLYDLWNHWYVLRDYKTNADLYRWFGDHLKAPLSPLKADDIGKYTVQQNSYKIQLENLGLHIGEMGLVWLREDGFEEVKLRNYDKLVSYAAKVFKQQRKTN